ncbi:hypothetical protein CSHISOI_10900, partial [Colletotrichum shisoi]
MLVLVAGATGTIGQKLIDSLHGRDHHVRGLGRNPSKLTDERRAKLQDFIMQSLRPTSYGAVPADEDRLGDDPKAGSGPDDDDEAKPQRCPQPLDRPWFERFGRVIVDFVLAGLALLFGIFGLWAYSVNGSTAGPGSTGETLVRVSQYAPTIFPVLFAAVAGATMKSIASWRIQASQGATLGSLEQYLGSQTISRAFVTQFNLGTYNLLGLSIVALWCLSPLGSQASLRVISVMSKTETAQTTLSAVDTFEKYAYSETNKVNEALMTVSSAVITSLMAAKFLKGRNQDVWGNVRLPAIENLERSGESVGESGWIEVSDRKPIEYASLIGTPVANLSRYGNTSFPLTGSYLSLSCPTIRLVPNQTVLSDWPNSLPALSLGIHGKQTDCNWTVGSFAQPHSIWESGYLIPGVPKNGTVAPSVVISRAACDLTMTHIEMQVTCTASLSGDSSGSICNPRAVRRHPNPPSHGDWTVLDKAPGPNSFLFLSDRLVPALRVRQLQPTTRAGLLDEPLERGG